MAGTDATPEPAESGYQVHDPAEDYKVEDAPGNRDDVDVPLALMKETDDGKGDEEVPESDFQGYTDPSADKEEKN